MQDGNLTDKINAMNENTKLTNLSDEPLKPGLTYSLCYNQPFISLFHADCMEIMKQYPDNYFDIAIVDPPYDYSIGKTYNILNSKKFLGTQEGRSKSGFKIGNSRINCLNEPPTSDYFNELFRVSKNQIIFGGNYFNLPLVTSWLICDKENGENTFGDGEMAWTNFRNPLRIIKTGIERNNRIHPTQKPVKLYEKIIKKYVKNGFKILDTHFGSGSIALAVDKANKIDKMNLHITACEINKEYIDSSIKRISEQTCQSTLSF
jgi:site-specific DNA-methyltransferase (adenine-specific)